MNVGHVTHTQNSFLGSWRGGQHIFILAGYLVRRSRRAFILLVSASAAASLCSSSLCLSSRGKCATVSIPPTSSNPRQLAIPLSRFVYYENMALFKVTLLCQQIGIPMSGQQKFSVFYVVVVVY